MSKKLPKNIMTMIQKNNTVLAIKTLAQERNISMADAKKVIDDYEQILIAKREADIAHIVQKQNSEYSNVDLGDKANLKSAEHESFNSISSTHKLTDSLNTHLNTIGYRKPLMANWFKRIVMILIVSTIMIYVLRHLVN